MTYKTWGVGLLFIAIVSTLPVFSLKSPAEVTDNDITTREARKKNPLTPTEKNLVAGKRLYQKQCMGCHGAAGKGDGKSAVDLDPKPSDLSLPEVAEKSDGEVFWRITRGRKPMPAFEKMMKEQDRWLVILFIRTLQKPDIKTQSSDVGEQRPGF